MPVVNGDPAVCPHNHLHGIWHSRNGVPIAICRISRPHLINIIKMLSARIAQAYPLNNFTMTPFLKQALIDDEALLTTLEAELERRG